MLVHDRSKIFAGMQIKSRNCDQLRESSSALKTKKQKKKNNNNKKTRGEID